MQRVDLGGAIEPVLDAIAKHRRSVCSTRTTGCCGRRCDRCMIMAHWIPLRIEPKGTRWIGRGMQRKRADGASGLQNIDR